MSTFAKPSVGFFDKSFNNSLTASYALSLQLDLQGLVITIYHPESNKYLALQSFVFEGNRKDTELVNYFDSVLQDAKWLGFSFQSVNIIYCNNQSTLIPQPLFDASNKELYLNFNHPARETQQINYNLLKSTQAANVYSLPVDIEMKLNSLWPNCRIYHFSSVLIESLGINFKNKTDNNTLFVNLRNDSFDVVYFTENKLHFYNSFRFKTAEDFIYFLLSAFEQLNLNPEEATLVLMGEIDKNAQNYHMIHRYIRHSEFIKRNDTFGYSQVLNEIAQHTYYVLFNVLQCE